MKLYFLILFIFTISYNAIAQTIMAGSLKVTEPAWFGPSKIIVKTDPYSSIPIGKIPFDRYFYYRLYFNTQSEIPDNVFLSIQNSKHSESELGFVYLSKDTEASDENLKTFYGIDILVPPLQPDLDYFFTFLQRDGLQYKAVFETYYKSGSNDAEKEFNKIIARKIAVSDPFRPQFSNIDLYYNTEIKPIYEKNREDFNKVDEQINAKIKSKDFIISGGRQIKIFDSGKDSQTILAGVDFNLQNNTASRVTADAGIIGVGFIKGFMTATHYVGVSYSFRSFDTDIPFRFVRRQIGINQLKLLSLHFGVTLRSLQKDNYRDNLFGNNNLMIGVGYRLSHAINIIGGGLLYNRLSPNSLLDSPTVGVRPYVGLSVNLKIKDALGEVAKLFTIGG